MSMKWIHENPPHWDEAKRTIVGGAPEGAFDVPACKLGDIVPGDWWRVEIDDATVGYGWMDQTWGDAEVLMCVDPEHQRHGVGAFIIENLDREAAARGLNYLYNVVRATHPDADKLTAWLRRHGFEPAHDENLLRRRVRS